MDPLELELQAVVNHPTVGVETDPGPLQEQQVLLAAGLFLQFPKMRYIYFYPDFWLQIFAIYLIYAITLFPPPSIWDEVYYKQVQAGLFLSQCTVGM